MQTSFGQLGHRVASHVVRAFRCGLPTAPRIRESNGRSAQNYVIHSLVLDRAPAANVPVSGSEVRHEPGEYNLKKKCLTFLDMSIPRQRITVTHSINKTRLPKYNLKKKCLTFLDMSILSQRITVTHSINKTRLPKYNLKKRCLTFLDMSILSQRITVTHSINKTRLPKYFTQSGNDYHLP